MGPTPGFWIVALAALLLSAFLAGCTEKDPAPAELRLIDLARFPDSYSGTRVTVTGTVRSHPAPAHYWIEDSDLNRVEVRPKSAVSELVGETVRITGTFQYSAGRGRSIDTGSITLVED